MQACKHMLLHILGRCLALGIQLHLEDVLNVPILARQHRGCCDLRSQHISVNSLIEPQKEPQGEKGLIMLLQSELVVFTINRIFDTSLS